LQVAPEQQPLGQLVALQPLQWPSVHVCPAGQAWQTPPPAPHDATVDPGRHAPCEQQPPGHDVPSQTQVLATQRWPAAQVSPLPQRQLPVDEQLSDRASHVTQVDPALPQALAARAAQVVPLQQPLGHDVASHTQAELTQRWPPAQAGPVPQLHSPEAPHRSALLVSQATQLVPLVPQVARVVGLQRLPAQQPPAHEVASQTQAPATQRWPAWQEAPPPHRQAPVGEQVSAFEASQAIQAAAPAPHAETERG
jgi:hypothetical protein